MPESLHAALQAAQWRYYTFIGGGARFMCSWHTADEDIEVLVADLRGAALGPR
jgi:threonine aldolase